jgi:hypothetical protein
MNSKENKESGAMMRICKNCGEVMAEPLRHEGKLWLFCSLRCKNVFDEERTGLKLDLLAM